MRDSKMHYACHTDRKQLKCNYHYLIDYYHPVLLLASNAHFLLTIAVADTKSR